MPAFTINDMQYTYRWKYHPELHPYFHKGPEYRFFMRMEGFDVFFVITEFLNKIDLNTAYTGRKAESLIVQKLPPRDFTHSEMLKWLSDNWK